MQPHDLAALDFTKSGGLVPAIVQHADSGAVLMLGSMDAAALAQTRASGRVTFYSRSKARLWTKGETSGHWLEVVALHADCDNDTVLVRARPAGPCRPACCRDPSPSPCWRRLPLAHCRDPSDYGPLPALPLSPVPRRGTTRRSARRQ